MACSVVSHSGCHRDFLIVTGLTRTNVNDIRIILIRQEEEPHHSAE